MPTGTAAAGEREIVLGDGVEAVLDVLTSSGEYAGELRKTSPSAGILSEAERQTVLAAFAESPS